MKKPSIFVSLYSTEQHFFSLNMNLFFIKTMLPGEEWRNKSLLIQCRLLPNGTNEF